MSHLWSSALRSAWGHPLRGFLCAIVTGWVAQPFAHGAPVHLVEEKPVQVSTIAPGTVLVDFGRVAFGNLQFTPAKGQAGTVVVHFGEALAEGRVNRNPPGTVRYAQVQVELTGGQAQVVAPAANKRNSTPPAVLTPPEWGVVLPFRWVEIEGISGDVDAGQLLRRSAFASTWNDNAAGFRSSDELLNRVWELCRYSIKATTFAGVYVDGDRERIAYEADAYLNQLSHYYCDPDTQMARDTFDWLMRFPSWPTEWKLHMIFIAHADWMQTGDTEWLADRYETLKSKLLLARARSDGLLESTASQIRKGDIVDWPPGERDGFVFRPVNTVVNAFHLEALRRMAELARALGKEEDASLLEFRHRHVREVFLGKMFGVEGKYFRDGEGTDHVSVHANLFPLAFGLVPEERCAEIVAYLHRRGMACSVYAAQYLLEALFTHGDANAALALITAPGERSWRHMVESGTTITWEAWDQRFKPNQDWNHAWGAAPANLLPRFVLGVQPLRPGLKQVLIRPHPGTLAFCSGRVPTARGPIEVEWKRDGVFSLVFSLPEETSARLELPAGTGSEVLIDGKRVKAVRQGDWLHVDGEWSGRHTVEVR